MDALNATWLTFLPTNTTSRKWRATPLRHDATLTKSRSDVSRPTDAFRNILCQVAQPFVSPSLISLRTCLMVADALTKRRTDVSRPTDAFRNICLGGANMYLQHRRCQVARPVSLHHTSIHCAFLAAVFALTRLEGFASPYKHIKDAYIGAERAEMTSCTSEQNGRDDFLHIGAELANDFIIGAELAEMTLYQSEQTLPR